MKPITFLTILCIGSLVQSQPLNLQHDLGASCASSLLDCTYACVIDGYVSGTCVAETGKCRCEGPLGRDAHKDFYQQSDVTRKVIVVPADEQPAQQQQSAKSGAPAA